MSRRTEANQDFSSRSEGRRHRQKHPSAPQRRGTLLGGFPRQGQFAREVDGYPWIIY